MSAALLLAGCVNYAGIHGSDEQVAPADRYVAAQSVPSEAGQWPGTDWAAQFGDAQLRELIDEALAGNPTIAQARSRVDKAAAFAQGQRATEGPRADARYSVTRELYSGNALFPEPLGGSWYTENNVLASASFDLDLWGKHLSAYHQALSAQRAAEADAQQARITLTASVARSYNRLATLYALRDIAQQTIAQRQEISRIAADRLRAGLDTEVEQRTAQSNVATSETSLSQLEGEITVARYQLAALAGQGPDRGMALTRPVLPDSGESVLPDNVPADLVARRADLAAARWQVDATLAGVRSKKAEFYPDVNLAAAFGFDAFGFGRFFNSESRQVSVGPAIHLPLFDAGALRAQLRDRYADVDYAVANYNQTLINALNDVAMQISSIHSSERELGDAQRAYDAAQRAYDLATARYRAGLSSQLTVLNADMNLLGQRRVLTELRMGRRDQQIALGRALGGGFNAAGTPLDTSAARQTGTLPLAGLLGAHPDKN
jgi:NodT family efflux transporter outer membrane factor (OMF) lipoprotein